MVLVNFSLFHIFYGFLIWLKKKAYPFVGRWVIYLQGIDMGMIESPRLYERCTWFHMVPSLRAHMMKFHPVWTLVPHTLVAMRSTWHVIIWASSCCDIGFNALYFMFSLCLMSVLAICYPCLIIFVWSLWVSMSIVGWSLLSLDGREVLPPPLGTGVQVIGALVGGVLSCSYLISWCILFMAMPLFSCIFLYVYIVLSWERKCNHID